MMDDTTTLLPHIKLRFNVDYPSLEECYVYGYECALADISEEENPYGQGSEEYEQWIEGWWAGFYGEPPLFTLTEDSEKEAVSDKAYHFLSQLVSSHLLANMLKITGALAATAIVGYQVFEMVA